MALDPECSAPNGALIRVEANGVCRCPIGMRGRVTGTGWGWSRNLGQVFGHELCGVVEEVGKEIKSFKKGDRVVVPFSQGDGTCEYCRNGQSNVCLTPDDAGAFVLGRLLVGWSRCRFCVS